MTGSYKAGDWVKVVRHESGPYSFGEHPIGSVREVSGIEIVDGQTILVFHGDFAYGMYSSEVEPCDTPNENLVEANTEPVDSKWLLAIGGEPDRDRVVFDDWLVFSCDWGCWTVYSNLSSHLHRLTDVKTRIDVLKLFSALNVKHKRDHLVEVTIEPDGSMIAVKDSEPVVVNDPVQELYDSFWRPLIEKDGKVDMEQLKKELHDFSRVLEYVPKVYEHITGGKIGKILTDPAVVCAFADEHYAYIHEKEPEDRPLREGDVVRVVSHSASIEEYTKKVYPIGSTHVIECVIGSGIVACKGVEYVINVNDLELVDDSLYDEEFWGDESWDEEDGDDNEPD